LEYGDNSFAAHLINHQKFSSDLSIQAPTIRLTNEGNQLKKRVIADPKG